MSEENNINKLIVGGVATLIILTVLITIVPFVIINAGERGVVMNWGQVQPNILNEGLHWRIPFAQSIKTLSVRVQKSDVKTEGASKDLQIVTMELVVNWHINSEKVNK